jgi:thiamine pyrophosphokinase
MVAPPSSSLAQETLWHPADILAANLAPERKFAIVVLNQPLSLPWHLYTQIWDNAVYHVGADGGANRVHFLNTTSPLSVQNTPSLELDTVIGDLDSLSPSVKMYWEKRGTRVLHDPDQYSTDFTKAVTHINSHYQQKLQCDVPIPSLSKDIVVLGGLGGRVDQGLSVLHHLYLFQSEPRYASGRMYLLSSEAITFVLQAGRHRIKAKQHLRGVRLGKHVGIIPMREPAVITTTGLEWDVQRWDTAFGGQMSTSNHVKEEWVTVETTKSVLFTIDLDIDDLDVDRDSSLG